MKRGFSAYSQKFYLDKLVLIDKNECRPISEKISLWTNIKQYLVRNLVEIFVESTIKHSIH